MSSVYVIVEGQTEQTFIREVIAPELAGDGLFLFAALIGKPGHKGGAVRFPRAVDDVGRFLKQRKDTFVSTMFDYFRVDPDWPGLADIRASQGANEKAEAIEAATARALATHFPDLGVPTRFIPYFAMYEFEALLFSDPTVLAEGLNVEVGRVDTILDECGEAEEIDERPDSAPSKRLLHLKRDYRKVATGVSIAKRIGLARMREACPHFDGWIQRLKGLSGSLRGQ